MGPMLGFHASMFSFFRVKSRWVVGLMLGAIVCLAPATASQLVIDFESIADSTVLTNQLPGLSFSNATVLTSTGSLNGIDFPPFSGVAVGLDDGGPMLILFDLSDLGATEVTDFSVYVTYVAPVTIEAFGAGNVLLQTATSTYAENYVSSGNPPNELLQISAPGMLSLKITGAPQGGSLLVDDIAITFTPSTGQVPEPSTWALVLLGVAGIAASRGRKN